MRRYKVVLAVGVSTLVLGCSGDGPAAPAVDEQPPLEPEPTVPVAATQWLRDNAVLLAGDDPSLAFDDLVPLGDAIGDARMVSLGEATHGTREFFRMKDRILRYLVTEKGFNAFAIEASWPEANRLDAYVRTGVGDPRRLLSGLYFWTWNTESVLAMIEWMRAHNEAGGDVGFYGFDMQYPGMAIYTVRRFLTLHDPDAMPDFNDGIECLARFANDATGTFPDIAYDDHPAADRDSCHAYLVAFIESMEAKRDEYVAASSARDFEIALRSAHVALQWEEMKSGRRARDASMAENALWLLDYLGEDAKLVVWAHNFHVSETTDAMGEYIRAALGDDVAVFGFSFAQGSFTGVRMSGSSFIRLEEHQIQSTEPGSYEEYFSSTGYDQFMLDLGLPHRGRPEAEWIAGPRPARAIGCCYDPARPFLYQYEARLPAEFDFLIHFEESSPTSVLPFNPPSVF